MDLESESAEKLSVELNLTMNVLLFSHAISLVQSLALELKMVHIANTCWDRCGVVHEPECKCEIIVER